MAHLLCTPRLHRPTPPHTGYPARTARLLGVCLGREQVVAMLQLELMPVQDPALVRRVQVPDPVLVLVRTVWDGVAQQQQRR